MFSISAVSRTAVPICRGAVQRNMSIVASPPTKHVSTAEKVLHGSLICVGICAYPVYAMIDVKRHKLEKWANEAD